MAELRTRKPTGAVAYPLVLVEGEESAGKSFALCAFSASERVDRTFLFEIGERTADEYGPLGRYEIVEHNGTYADLVAQLDAAMAIPSDPARPNVIGLDSGSVLWGLNKDWASARARRSRANIKRLEEDPDAAIETSMNLWNDAKDRWYHVINKLRAWPGIAIMICRGKETAKVVNGSPVAGETDYAIEAEKTTEFGVSAWVRMKRPHRATLIAVKSLALDLPAKGLELPNERMLEHLVFEVLGAGGSFSLSKAVMPSIGQPAVQAQKRFLAWLVSDGGFDEATAKREARGLWSLAAIGAEVTDKEWADLIESARARIATLKEETAAEAAAEAAAQGDAAAPASDAAPAATPPAEDPATQTATADQRPARDGTDEVPEGIDPLVAAMHLDEVIRELELRQRTETGTPGELRARLSDLVRGEAAEAGAPETKAPEFGIPPEEIDRISRDVESYAPKDVTAQLEARGLDKSGTVQDRRARLREALITERVKGSTAAEEEPPTSGMLAFAGAPGEEPF